jgi:hypothetical protein
MKAKFAVLILFLAISGQIPNRRNLYIQRRLEAFIDAKTFELQDNYVAAFQNITRRSI